MSPRRSVRKISWDANREDKRWRKLAKSTDSFQNFLANVGIGTDNQSTAGGYGFNPITKIRPLLEWIHRGSWLGGVSIDVISDDMTRAGVDIQGTMDPGDIQKLEKAATRLKIWSKINETTRWARLYGGCIAVILLKGQDYATPLQTDRVLPGQFQGLAVFDRWMCSPSLEDLVQEEGPDLGLPKYYRIDAGAPSLAGRKVHHTRCLRLIGVKLPYWQAIVENLWGLSVLERLYDRLLAFDSATQGAAQLVYRAYLRVVKIKGLRDVVAAGGEQYKGLIAFVDMMRRFQTAEGITLLDADDSFEGHTPSAFGGLSETLIQFGQQIGGAIGCPLTRLFGQSPVGMSATGESDFRMYYDNINAQQEAEYRIPVTRVYTIMARSEKIQVPDDFDIAFRPLWQLEEEKKAQLASQVTSTVREAEEAGLVLRETALKELKQSSKKTGIWTNITDEDIDAAKGEGPPEPVEVRAAEARHGEEGGEAEPVRSRGSSPTENRSSSTRIETHLGDRRRVQDQDINSRAAQLAWRHGLQVVIENPQGSIRRGYGWEAHMPADYGYIRAHEGADGDQIDCYVGPAPESNVVFIVDQRNLKTGDFDEHKCLLGYWSKDSAIEDYVLGYTDGTGPKRIMKVTQLSMDDFKEWLTRGDLRVPYQEVERAVVQ